MKKYIIFYLLFFAILVLPQNSKTPSKVNQQFPILTLETLLNYEYNFGNRLGRIKLKDGNYHKEFQNGSIEVWHHLHISCELNGDSLIDAIIVFTERNGGAGRWQYIIPVLNINGKSQPQKSFCLEDREDIQKIYQKNRKIYVDVLVHGENDYAIPTVNTTWEMEFRIDQLMRLN